LLSGASLIARERAYTDKITLCKMTLCRQCGPLNALVSEYAQLVLDALRYVQPVEVSKERSDVVSCQACGSVDDGLQTVQVTADRPATATLQ